MSNIVTTLQAAIEARLKEDPQLSAVAIITEDRKDLNTEIETAIAKLGLCIVIGTASLGVSNPNLPGPVFDSVEFSAIVAENVLLNRSLGSELDAMSAAIAVHEQLHMWRPIGTQFSGYMVLSEKRRKAIEAIPADEMVYECRFTLGNTQ